MYPDNFTAKSKTIERVQTGVRIEKRLLRVLKGLSEHLSISVGDLLEGRTLRRTVTRARNKVAVSDDGLR